MKKMIVLVLIVLGVGVWFGINIAKDKPLLSNPFAEKDIRDKAKDAARGIFEEGKRSLQEEVDKRR